MFISFDFPRCFQGDPGKPGEAGPSGEPGIPVCICRGVFVGGGVLGYNWVHS